MIEHDNIWQSGDLDLQHIYYITLNTYLVWELKAYRTLRTMMHYSSGRSLTDSLTVIVTLVTKTYTLNEVRKKPVL